MIRWNIKKILFYSHDGRRRDITFDLEKVNIITGRSRTGKSAITEVIDYVMGSSECNIPSYVQVSSSWVGLLWVKNETEFLICRKIPEGKQKSSEEFYFDVGHDISLPEAAEKLYRRLNLNGALRKFEQQIRIGDIQVETYNATARPTEPVTIRHVMPYLLQDDNTIINKTNLFRDEGDDQKRQAIIDRLPYFLGVVDEAFVQKEVELRRLRARLAVEERKIAAAERLRGDEINRARSLILEAAQQGLVGQPK